jgi:hypothetical protein
MKPQEENRAASRSWIISDHDIRNKNILLTGLESRSSYETAGSKKIQHLDNRKNGMPNFLSEFAREDSG